MNKQHACDSIREMVFNYRRGELSELDAALFEEALVECPDCSRYASRIIEMLDITAEAEAEAYLAEPVTPAFADALFDAITAGIEEDARAEQAPPPVRLEFDLEASDDGELDDLDGSSRHGWWPVFIAAAALLAVGVGVLFATQERAVAPEVATNDAAADDARFRDELQKLQPQQAEPEAIKVFASAAASWRLEGEAPAYVLRLEEGTVLVEFLPREGERLRVVTDEAEVSVVGTVFYVSADEPEAKRPARVGVLTGKVRVKREDGARAITLEDGQELAHAEVRAIGRAAREQAEAFVDLEAHREALSPEDAPPVKATEEKARAPRVVAEADMKPAARAPARRNLQREIDEMRAAAQEATRARDYAGAARKYERLLDRLPPQHVTRATLRLELARLYMRHLGQRDRAIEHLRRFVEQHPHDVAAPSARRQLCRLLGLRASQDPACSMLD